MGYSEINVAMLGPLGCGKTSLLVSMFDRFDDVVNGIGGVHLRVAPDCPFTQQKKDIAFNRLGAYFNAGSEQNMNDQMNGNVALDSLEDETKQQKLMYGGTVKNPMAIGVRGDTGLNTYRFELYSSEIGIIEKINFYDFPGEALQSDRRPNWHNPQDLVDIDRRLAKSNIIFLVVDTPKLMEYRDKYSGEMCDFAVNALKVFDDTYCVKKSVSFLPIKSEKWILNACGSINKVGCAEVHKKIEHAYSTLIDYMGSKAAYYYWNFMPVATLGDIEYSHCQEKVNAKGKIEALDMYKYAPRNNSPAKLRPVNCAYPMASVVEAGIIDYQQRLKAQYDMEIETAKGRSYWFNSAARIQRECDEIDSRYAPQFIPVDDIYKCMDNNHLLLKDPEKSENGCKVFFGKND